MLQIIFQAVTVKICAKKNTDSTNKTFVQVKIKSNETIATEVTTYVNVRKKQKSFCKLAY